MSYPKRRPVLEKETERASKLNQKRDQIQNLLINKFRGKFNVIAQSDELDATIRFEVQQFINSHQMTEHDLVLLDKKLTELAKQKGFAQSKRYPTGKGQNQNNANVLSDPKLQGYRQTTNGLGVVKSIVNSPDNQRVLKTMDANEGGDSRKSDRQVVSKSINNRTAVGSGRASLLSGAGTAIMSHNDDQWNKIVLFNVNQFNQEQEDHKRKIKDNQEMMKSDLQKQLELQKQMKDEEKVKEREFILAQQEHNKMVEIREQQRLQKQKLKMIQEKQIRDVQLADIQVQKIQQVQHEKQVAEEKRKQLEKEAEEQKLKEQAKIETHRKVCQKQLNENKLLKEQQKLTDAQYNRVVPDGQDLLGQLFVEKKHTSYDRRAKNDYIIDKMKNMVVGDPERRRHVEEQVTTRHQQEQIQQQLAREEERKLKHKQNEIATKQFLDMQIQAKQNKIQLVKAQANDDAQYINKDVQAHRDHERLKKEEKDRLLKENQSSLAAQIANGKSKTVQMAAHEYKLNKPLLDAINQHLPSPERIKKPY